MNQNEEDFRDGIGTVNSNGERVWIYPKRVNGVLYKWRSRWAFIQLFILITLPFIKINGKPIIMLNIVERKFVFFGHIFWPEDMYIFCLLFITVVITLVTFTAIFGRVFCGWFCPHTVFLEMVFRRLERLIEGDAPKQKKADNAKLSSQIFLRKALKHFLFYAISFFIANIFLAYIIGGDALLQIVTQPPSKHFVGFIAICLFSIVFYGVFSWFREQACIMVCPYGRLQSVLQDQSTVTISYDFVRGEPRGHLNRNEKKENQGDCIDCKKCVAVCPTGIDIRNGLQMECVNCTFCIDACNDVMEKIDKPKGLIRYASHNMITNKQKFKISTRVIAYGIAVLALLAIDIFVLINRAPVDASIIRMPGSMCTPLPDNEYMNVFNATFWNKTFDPRTCTVKILNVEGKVKVGDGKIELPGEQVSKLTLMILLPERSLKGKRNIIQIGIFEKDKLINTIETSFLGPKGGGKK